MNHAVDLSVVLEWENVLLRADDDCLLMLRSLRNQLREIERAVELIVIFDPTRVDRSSIQRILQEELDLHGLDPSLDLRLHEVQGKSYYQLKNEGSAISRGQVIVFLDSDVVPEKDWLQEISRPFFERPEIDVLAGHTYLRHRSLMDKAFALGWFFPLRDSRTVLNATAEEFFANNVAFRRETFLAHLFPEMPDGVSRRACKELAEALRASGTDIWQSTSARAQHPPPSSLRHYVLRALAHGRDNMLLRMDAGEGTAASLFDSLRWGGRRTLRTAKRIATNGETVGLRWWQAPIALGVMSSFYFMAALGSCVTAVNPRYAREHWQI